MALQHYTYVTVNDTVSVTMDYGTFERGFAEKAVVAMSNGLIGHWYRGTTAEPMNADISSVGLDYLPGAAFVVCVDVGVTASMIAARCSGVREARSMVVWRTCATGTRQGW